ncbi:ankyrin [Neocallimastix sp. 'constans']
MEIDIIKNQRKEILNIISESKNDNFVDVTTLREYINTNKINLKDLNSDDFDILISVIDTIKANDIRENYYTCSIIDYIIEQFLYDLLSFYNYGKLESIFKKYIFKNSFILSLLTIYKNKIPVSIETLKSIIEKERTKLKIDSSIYLEAKKFSSNSVAVLMDYDGESDEKIFEKIVNNRILERAIDDDNNTVIEKIVNLDSFDINKINMKKILENQCYDYTPNSVESVEFFFKVLKRKQPNLNLLKLNFKDVIWKGCMEYNIFQTKEEVVNLILNIFIDSIIESIHKKLKISNKYYSQSLLVILNMAIKLNNIEIIKRVFENKLLKDKLDRRAKDEDGNFLVDSAFFTYIERNNELLEREMTDDAFLEFNTDEGINTDVFEYILNHETNLKETDAYSLFLLALERKYYCLVKCFLSQPRFLKNYHFDRSVGSFDPRKAIPFSLFFKFMERAQIDYKGSVTISETFSDPVFSEILDQYISDNIAKNDDINRYSEILYYTVYDDLEKVKSNIQYFEENHINLNMLDYINKGITPLLFSYILNKEEIFNYLFEHCNIKRPDGFGNNLFHYSIIKEDVEMVNRLFEHGLKLNKNKFKELTRLSTIDKERSILLIKFLIEHGASIEDTFGNKETLMIDSILDSNFPLVQYLIDKEGIDVNLTEEDYTPLSAAIEVGSVPITRLLVEKGADVNYRIPDSIGKSKSLLMSCIEMGQKELAQILMEHHAKILYEDNYDYTTLIENLRDNDDTLKLSDYIRQNHIQVSTTEKIRQLIYDQRLDLLKILRDHQLLEVNEPDEYGNTPLFYAVKYGRDRMIKFLIDCGADTSVINHHGETLESINKRYNYTYNRSTYNKFKRINIEKIENPKKKQKKNM